MEGQAPVRYVPTADKGSGWHLEILSVAELKKMWGWSEIQNRGTMLVNGKCPVFV